MINIGKYIEMAINWLTENFTLFFDAINVGIYGAQNEAYKTIY